MNIHSSGSTTCSEVWIGLAQVIERRGGNVLQGSPGAFVNILARACGVEEYHAVVTGAVDELSLDLKEIEDAEPLWQRTNRTSVEPQLLNEAELVRITGAVRFGTFHAFDEDSG